MGRWGGAASLGASDNQLDNGVFIDRSRISVIAVSGAAKSSRCLGLPRLLATGHSIYRSARGYFRCGAVRGAAASANSDGYGSRRLLLARVSPGIWRHLALRRFSLLLRPASLPARL